MTADVGYAALQIFPSLKGFEGRVNREVQPALSRSGSSSGERFGSTFGTKASRSIHDKFRESAKYLVGPLIGAFAVEKIGQFIGDSIRGAIDDQGAENRANLVFGRLSKKVGQFSDNAAQTYGLADSEARSAASGFGILFKQTDLSAKAGAKASIQMVKLGADLAAFAHTDPAQAFQALQRGLQGSTRGLKPFGILIDTAQQKAEALRLGLLKPVKDQAKIRAAQANVLKDQAAYNDVVAKSGKGSIDAQVAGAKLGSAQEALRKSVEGTVPPLTAQQKILANQSLIMRQTTTQQGQFGRSSDDLLTQQKRLSAGLDNAKDRIGKGLLPITTDLVTFLNRKAVPAVTDFSDWFEKKGSKSIGNFVDDVRPLAKSLLPAVSTGFEDITGFLKTAAPYAKKTIDAFNSLPDWAQKAIVLGGAAAYVGKRTGLLSVGTKAATGALGKVASRAEPLPVFVVNEGFGGGGAASGGKSVLSKGLDFGKKAAPFGAATAGVGFAGLAAVTGLTVYGGIKSFQMEAAPGQVNVGGLSPGAQQEFDRQRLNNQFPGQFPNLLGQRNRLQQFPGEFESDASRLDVIRGNLGKISQGFDLMGRSGVHTFDTLEPKTKRYGDFLSHIPDRVTTKVDLDLSKAYLELDRFRAQAGRHISSELTIELAGHGPSHPSLDGVRRNP